MLPVDGTPRTLSKLADSRSAELYTWGEHHVVKLFRLGFPREAVDQEVQNAAMVHALRIPTPQPVGTVEIKGRSGIVFERCDGPTLYELIANSARPAAALARAFFDLQLIMHQCRNPALPPAARTLEDAILHARVPEPVKQRALEAIQSLPQAQAVCHGDYHPLNVILSPAGAMAVDWHDAGTGDPMFDVARSLLYLRFSRPENIESDARQQFLKCYLQYCREAWGDELERIDLWRMPLAIARLEAVTDATEFDGLIRLIENDSGMRVR